MAARLGVTKEELIAFVRLRGLAVLATVAPDGSPQAALVGVAATDRGELVFDTAKPSRKLRNLLARPRVALVIGCHDEVTVQCEGDADVLAGGERERCLDAYLTQYPDGRERARDPGDRARAGSAPLAAPERLPGRIGPGRGEPARSVTTGPRRSSARVRAAGGDRLPVRPTRSR